MKGHFRSASFFLALAWMALLLIAGCSRESGQKQAVRSSSESGSSTAPSSASAEKQDKALVRAIHALPGQKAVDVLADETVVFTNVDYKTVTPYRELPDNRFVFRVRLAGVRGQPLAENSEGLMGGSHYSLVAMVKPDGSAQLMALSDNLTPPAEGKAKVRLVHGAPAAGELDVFVAGRKDPLFDAVNVGTETMYNEVDPMMGSLQVRPDGKSTTLLTIPDVNFEAGKIYTIVLTGKAKGAPRLEAIKIEDQFLGTPGQRPSY